MHTEPIFGEPPPATTAKRYETALAPLLDKPDHWAEIGEYATPESAYQAALSLRSRRYKIPRPDGLWEFLSVDEKVYAIYHSEADE
jgi:hypothetical protein